MITHEGNAYNPDILCGEFAHRHNLLDTQLVRHDLLAIYWTTRTKLEIDASLETHTKELDHLDPLWALLRSMLDRIFEHVEGAIVAYVTGSPASSEVISRTAIESSINLLYILDDERKGDRLSQYLAHYYSNEQRELDQWLKAASKLAGEAQKVHQLAATEKRTRIHKLQGITDLSLSQVGLPTTRASATSWPKISERFRLLGLEIDYRTVYAALCSQTHNDAEDLLNYFFAVASGNQELIEKAALETINFSRLMLYYAVKYYIAAAGGYAIRFELTEALEVMNLGRNAILQTLEKIAKEL
ncbi:MAG TPA: DUF5677 domain-containing protein [Chloroflexota bacterium]|nr:DUF5677 domain-containing protein [Chloroflexota bacterium]